MKLSNAYLAGLVDGDGSINIYHDKLNSKKSPCYIPRVSVGMTSEALIRSLHNKFGGTFHIQDFNRWKRMYYWQVANAGAKKFLERIKPHLVVKKRQAKLALKLIASKAGRTAAVSTKLNRKRAGWHEACRVLNKRGPE